MIQKDLGFSRYKELNRARQHKKATKFEIAKSTRSEIGQNNYRLKSSEILGEIEVRKIPRRKRRRFYFYFSFYLFLFSLAIKLSNRLLFWKGRIDILCAILYIAGIKCGPGLDRHRLWMFPCCFIATRQSGTRDDRIVQRVWTRRTDSWKLPVARLVHAGARAAGVCFK